MTEDSSEGMVTISDSLAWKLPVVPLAIEMITTKLVSATVKLLCCTSEEYVDVAMLLASFDLSVVGETDSVVL